MDLDQLLDIAASHGITVTKHTGGKAGYWLDTHNMISLRNDLSHRDKRAQLAHELGHATSNHLSNAIGWLYERQERQADRYAANALVSEAEYRQAEQLYGHEVCAIADELDVPCWIIETWQKHHQTITV